MTSNTAKNPKPNPGSDEAIKAGCTCPVLDNGRGRGSSFGDGAYWINANCPLYGLTKGEDNE